MAVRIIIDRKVKKGKELDFSKLLREMRSKALLSKGYISGETLRALNDRQNYVVISTWQSLDDWKNWGSFRKSIGYFGRKRRCGHFKASQNPERERRVYQALGWLALRGASQI